jgi:hypothetical protein
MSESIQQLEEQIMQHVSPVATRLMAAAAVVALAAASFFVAYFDPSKMTLFPVCPLYALTGFACPGCGLTRGFHELSHGRIIPALDFNILIPVWAVIIAYVFVSLVLHAARGRGLPLWPTWPRFLWGFMIVLLIFGVLRNIPVWPFTILFP